MYCKYCGHELNSENICTNPECPGKSNSDVTFSEFCDSNGITTSEMINFIGRKKSHDYYLDKWSRYQENENFVSWNWSAFIGGFYWFWYRKMYSVMLIILAVSIGGSLLLDEWVIEILSLGITIGCGLFGNQLYMKHATKKIVTIKSHTNSKNKDLINKRLDSNGGTTILPIIFFVITVILSIVTIIFVGV